MVQSGDVWRPGGRVLPECLTPGTLGARWVRADTLAGMPSDAAPDQSAADGYLQRAHLLAELGRYDEGIGELTALIATEPAHVPALTMLARMHLAADRPSEALAAAEAAVTAAGGPPADAVTTFGYVDEPHLARALRRYVGRTAGELRAGAGGAIALDPAQRVTS